MFTRFKLAIIRQEPQRKSLHKSSASDSSAEIRAASLRNPTQIVEVLFALYDSPVVTGLVFGAHQTVWAAASLSFTVDVAAVAPYRRHHM